MANTAASMPTALTGQGVVTVELPGAERAIPVASFEVAVPIVVTVGADQQAEGLVDTDGLRANLADALDAVAAELRAGA